MRTQLRRRFQPGRLESALEHPAHQVIFLQRRGQPGADFIGSGQQASFTLPCAGQECLLRAWSFLFRQEGLLQRRLQDVFLQLGATAQRRVAQAQGVDTRQVALHLLHRARAVAAQQCQHTGTMTPGGFAGRIEQAQVDSLLARCQRRVAAHLYPGLVQTHELRQVTAIPFTQAAAFPAIVRQGPEARPCLAGALLLQGRQVPPRGQRLAL